ncbi:MAG: NAD-dependent protein deacylase [Clostridiales bacterium]|nr:NAD-dependent protein deacylase [Clostridiales bacterium]
MHNQIGLLDTWLRESKSCVFFGGAGVSCESGIPDFRSTDGLYRTKWKENPETILSATYFWHKQERFFEFYREKLLYPNARPNPAHLALARMEEMGLLSAVITQNIDGLHQAAGSKNVIELHGSTLRNRCTHCGTFYSLDDVMHMPLVPMCHCGHVIKPEVTLYEEALPEDALEAASYFIDRADMMLIGGTSLSVYPAAGFARSFRGRIVIINKSPTPMDKAADLVIPHPIGQALGLWQDLYGRA